MISWHQAERFVIPLQLMLAMFGMGATLGWDDFKNVLRHPSGVGIGVGLQWFVVPALAVATSAVLGLTPGWALGLLIVAVTPGGAFSNLLTYLARAHLALSVSVTLVATVASTVTAPLILRLLATAHLPANFSFPTTQILINVTIDLLLPMIAGMLVYRFANAQAPRISKISIWASMTLVVFLAILAMTKGQVKISEFGWKPPLIILGFAIVVHHVAIEISRRLGRYDDESVALAIEVSVRNGGVGLLLLRFFYPDQVEQAQILYSVLLYTGLQIWIPIPAILLHRFGKSPLFLRSKHVRPA